MKKICIFLTIFACLPYFSLFIWQPTSSESLSGQAEELSTQETSSKITGGPYYIKKIGAEDTASTIANYPIRDTVVAIIDTGAELSHEDLADSLWVNEAEKNGIDNVDDDGNGYIDDIYGVDFVNNAPTPVPSDPSAPLRYGAPEDDSNTSHGTHVSGIIGMNPNNSVGYAGVGYHTKIMILKAGNSKNNFSFANATKAVEYAVANGADVINMSFGSYKQNDAFAKKLENASKSCLLVAAAGNDGYSSSSSMMYPAAYPYVIGVMAGSTDYNVWTSSNYTDSSPAPYDILCPGESILSTVRYNSYEEKNGTSMASPMAAGSAAVIMGFLEANKSYRSREELLADTKKYLLMSDSVYTYTSDSGMLYITPRLNLKHSLQHILDDLDAEQPSVSPLNTPRDSAAPAPTVSATPTRVPASPTSAVSATPTQVPASPTAPVRVSASPVPTTTAAPKNTSVPSAAASPQNTSSPTTPSPTTTTGQKAISVPAPAAPTAATVPANTATLPKAKTNIAKSLRMKKVRMQKKKNSTYVIKWKKCNAATRYQIRVKDKKKGEIRWYYTKKTTIKLRLRKSHKRYQISIRAQKIQSKKTWSGSYKRLS